MENVSKEYLYRLVARQKTNADILDYLEMDFGIVICKRTLIRWFRKHNIQRHDSAVPAHRVIEAIETERNGPRRYCGIRYLQFALRNSHDLLVTRRQVADVCTWLNPDGTALRANAAWERRLRYCPGPNYRWCIDGYDKLSQFGIYIHGCVDEYSRSIRWLEAHVSNRLPDLIVRYFLKAVEAAGVSPDYVVSDFGREADLVADSQTFFHRHSTDPASHHRWNYSITNVTIESYWRQHRQRSSQYWIDRLRTLEDRGIWDGNLADQLALWAVYMPLIQTDLREVTDYHNGHRIRCQRDRLRPSGIPEDLYLFPERHNGRHCGIVVTRDELADLVNMLQFDNLDVPDVLPDLFKAKIDAWIRCNRVTVSRDNADDIYAQLRHLLAGLIANAV